MNVRDFDPMIPYTVADFLQRAESLAKGTEGVPGSAWYLELQFCCTINRVASYRIEEEPVLHIQVELGIDRAAGRQRHPRRIPATCLKVEQRRNAFWNNPMIDPTLTLDEVAVLRSLVRDETARHRHKEGAHWAGYVDRLDVIADKLTERIKYEHREKAWEELERHREASWNRGRSGT